MDAIASAAYRKNTPLRPMSRLRLRNVCATRKLAPQLATVHTDIALLRMPSGKISEIISQKTGPRPTANAAMYTIRAARATQP
jgi:hypothetical protein